MTFIRCLLVMAFFLLMLPSCSNNKNVIYDKSLSDIYAFVQQKMQHGDYNSAIKELEILNKQCFSGFYAQQIQLYLIYAYYQSANFSLAETAIDRFLRLNPAHTHTDYVFYMRGLIYMTLDDQVSQGFFGMDRSDRNPKYAREAFRTFKKLILSYPNSQYSTDTIRRLMYLKNRLAKYELAVVKYYDKRGAYIAVVNRVSQMLRDFSDTQATHQALQYMERAYRELQLNHQAEKIANIRMQNLN